MLKKYLLLILFVMLFGIYGFLYQPFDSSVGYEPQDNEELNLSLLSSGTGSGLRSDVFVTSFNDNFEMRFQNVASFEGDNLNNFRFDGIDMYHFGDDFIKVLDFDIASFLVDNQFVNDMEDVKSRLEETEQNEVIEMIENTPLYEQNVSMSSSEFDGYLSYAYDYDGNIVDVNFFNHLYELGYYQENDGEYSISTDVRFVWMSNFTENRLEMVYYIRENESAGIEEEDEGYYFVEFSYENYNLSNVEVEQNINITENLESEINQYENFEESFITDQTNNRPRRSFQYNDSYYIAYENTIIELDYSNESFLNDNGEFELANYKNFENSVLPEYDDFGSPEAEMIPESLQFCREKEKFIISPIKATYDWDGLLYAEIDTDLNVIEDSMLYEDVFYENMEEIDDFMQGFRFYDDYDPEEDDLFPTYSSIHNSYYIDGYLYLAVFDEWWWEGQQFAKVNLEGDIINYYTNPYENFWWYNVVPFNDDKVFVPDNYSWGRWFDKDLNYLGSLYSGQISYEFERNPDNHLSPTNVTQYFEGGEPSSTPEFVPADYDFTLTHTIVGIVPLFYVGSLALLISKRSSKEYKYNQGVYIRDMMVTIVALILGLLLFPTLIDLIDMI